MESSQAFGPNFENPHKCSPSRVASPFPAAEKGEGASQDPTKSVTYQLLSLLFEPCHAGCPPIILLCLLLPHSPVPLFMGSPERRGDFSSPCLLHTITPICSSRLLVPLFFRVMWIWVQFTLSGMLFWTVLVWEGSLVHRLAQGVGEMCIFKLIRIFSSRNANGGKAIKAACFLLSNLC